MFTKNSPRRDEITTMVLHVMLVQLTLVLLSSAPIPSLATTAIAKPNCDDRCGDVEIPYPFGMTEDCYLDETFLITCNHSFYPPKPFLWKSTINVTKILVHGQLHILQFIAHDCYDQQGKMVYNNDPWLWLSSLSQFTISNTENKFTAVGCDTYAIVRADHGERTSITRCTPLCEGIEDIDGGPCSGVGCCQTSIPKGSLSINVTLRSYYNYSLADMGDFNRCSYAFVVQNSEFDFSRKFLRDLQKIEKLPVVLDWTIGNETCEVANKNSTSYACKDHKSYCYEPKNVTSGYRCSCREGYEGNPYLSNGCRDIDECANATLNKCERKCINNIGNYTCSCPKYHKGNGRTNGKGCVLDQLLVIKFVIGIAIGVTVLLVSSSWLYVVFKKRKLIKEKEIFFQQNGGLMLQQLSEGSTDTLKIFTIEELKKATNNYDARGMIGRGGSGTIYKGVLTDHRIVAIKRCKILDESLIKQFINEVVVLSKVNHRNVVKFIGCCLETEVPLLVFEFINNGTLFSHIHNESKALTISWDIRLRIAAETAGVLSYLHSYANPPIIHGDIKSANILLDDEYTAKVIDIGASKLVPLDQTHLSTIVEGTLGYLDPEYLHKTEVTEKSDVYSFGVVLAELLTGEKAFSFDRSEQNLATYFLSSLDANCLFQILEKHLVNEGNTEQLKEVAMLARRCLNVKGDERPTMKNIAMELEGLRKVEKHPWINIEMNSEEESLLGEKSDVSSSTTTKA